MEFPWTEKKYTYDVGVCVCVCLMSLKTHIRTIITMIERNLYRHREQKQQKKGKKIQRRMTKQLFESFHLDCDGNAMCTFVNALQLYHQVNNEDHFHQVRIS